ncbi:hypothetical protein ACRS8V_07405 [Staphylococcus epidermidis]
MSNKEEILNLFKNVSSGNAIFVNEQELKICNDLKNEGKIDFKAKKTIGENGEIELADPIFINKQ